MSSPVVTPHVPQQYPAMMYKYVPIPPPPTEATHTLETTVVNNDQEAADAAADGWSDTIPPDPDAPPPAKHATAPPHPQGTPAAAPLKHEEKKK